MENYVWLVLTAGGISFFAGIAAAIYFWRREKRVVNQIQKMLDKAISGRLVNEHLDESKVSAIENSMWRYLCDKEVFEQGLRKEKAQMQTQISDIAHQAVIPISNIILYSQLLEESSSAKDEISVIVEQAEILDFLIETLVKLSRMEIGIVHVNIKYQAVQPLLDVIKNQFQGRANEKKLLFTVDGTEELAVFDMKWTMEAVANIVDNAIKYTPENGRVKVSVDNYPSFIRLAVADTGIGISEEEQGNIFNRFYRSPTVSDEPGVGIGLYLARKVMKAQHGYIKLSSQVGVGSQFSLYFMKEEMSQN